jgi:hypothetical protein
VPAPLPPIFPLLIDGRIQQSLESTLLALGRLGGVLASLRSGSLLLFELDEAPGVRLDDVKQSPNTFAAPSRGCARSPRTTLSRDSRSSLTPSRLRESLVLESINPGGVLAVPLPAETFH